MRQESWKDSGDWQYGRVTSSAGPGVWILWLFTVLLVALSVPMLAFVLPDELAKGHWPVLFVLAFPLAGFWAVYQAILKTLEWRRFGRLVLELDPFPGSLGGDAGGWVDLPVPFDGESRFQVSLSCIHVGTTGRGRHRSRHEQAIWQDERTLPGDFGSRGTRLRFWFQLPGTLPESEPPSDDFHYWAVHLRAALPGIDLDRVFEVPVFETVEPQLARYKPRGGPHSRSPDLPRQIVRVSRTTEGLRLDYPASRNRSLGLAVLVAGLFFLSITFALGWGIWDEGSLTDLARVLRGFVLLLSGVAGISLVVGGLYLLANSLQVLLGRQHLATRRRLLGIPVQLRHVSGDDVTGLHHAIAGQTGQGPGATVRYALYATLADGSRMSLGDGLKGRVLADQMLGMVCAACECPNLHKPEIMPVTSVGREARQGGSLGEQPGL